MDNVSRCALWTNANVLRQKPNRATPTQTGCPFYPLAPRLMVALVFPQQLPVCVDQIFLTDFYFLYAFLL